MYKKTENGTQNINTRFKYNKEKPCKVGVMHTFSKLEI